MSELGEASLLVKCGGVGVVVGVVVVGQRLVLVSAVAVGSNDIFISLCMDIFNLHNSM